MGGFSPFQFEFKGALGGAISGAILYPLMCGLCTILTVEDVAELLFIPCILILYGATIGAFAGGFANTNIGFGAIIGAVSLSLPLFAIYLLDDSAPGGIVIVIIICSIVGGIGGIISAVVGKKWAGYNSF